MHLQTRRLRHIPVVMAVVVLTLTTAIPASAAAPDHLSWATRVVDEAIPANNLYDSNPSYVTWAGTNGATATTNRTLCATFVNRVLMQAYGLTTRYFSAWQGSTSPFASTWHDTIEAQNRMTRILRVSDARAGDILAIEYLDGTPNVTGHISFVFSTPTPIASTATGTTYNVVVEDSSSTGHGPSDTRLQADGTFRAGAGRGIMRLYTDATDQIIGYTWSDYSWSTYYNQTSRHAVIGRLAL